MNPEVDLYLLEGCGRCDYYQTDKCKVHSFPNELKLLREIVLESGLKEEYKWSQPCYTYQGKNVLIVTAFKDYACLAFFKGSLLSDPYNILITPGKSSQAAKQARYTTTEEIIKDRAILNQYIQEATEIEKQGLKVEFKANPDPIPAELTTQFEIDPELKEGFNNLTPGRQRGYILHFSQPKQSKTRTARIKKLSDQIKAGVGLHDTYRNSLKNN